MSSAPDDPSVRPATERLIRCHGDGDAGGGLSLRATSSRSGGRPVRGLDLPLPCLPASDGQRLRDAGGVHPGSSARRRSLQRVPRVSDEADRKEHIFHFCPDCGSQVFYTEPAEPDLIVVSVGAFADPSFPPPTESGYHHRRHPWVALPDSIERDDRGVWARSTLCTRLAATPRRPTVGASCSRRIRIRGSSTTSPAARASLVGRPTRSSTCGARSNCGRAAAQWQSDDSDFDAIRERARVQGAGRLGPAQHRRARRRPMRPLTPWIPNR